MSVVIVSISFQVAREKANSMHEKIGYPDLFDDEALLVKEYYGVR